MLGKCVDYDAIEALAAAAGARLLCDAAESFGATYEGRAAGSFGDASVLSFNGNKIMTTSGGGMLLTDDEDLAAHVRKLSTQAREPVPHYEHTEIGYNYRLSNILAALGRAQLVRLDDMIKRRRAWRERYRQLLADRPGVRILGGADDAEDNCWLTAIVVDPAAGRLDRRRHLGEALSAEQVETRPMWKPMHLQPVFAGLDGTLDGTSERIFAHGLTLPSGSAMTDEQFQRIESVIQRRGGCRMSRRRLRPRQAGDRRRGLARSACSSPLPVQAVVAVLVRLKLGSPVSSASSVPARTSASSRC